MVAFAHRLDAPGRPKTRSTGFGCPVHWRLCAAVYQFAFITGAAHQPDAWKSLLEVRRNEAITGQKICAKRLWQDTDSPCHIGAQCSADDVMPYARGACVATESGRTQCWDVCNVNHTASEYSAEAAAHVQLRVVQARKGLLGDVSCPCQEPAAIGSQASFLEVPSSVRSGHGSYPEPAMREESLGLRRQLLFESDWELTSHRHYSRDCTLELRCVHCLTAAAGRDYFVSEGTLLGATRNGFLLPWDADGDILFDARGQDGKVDYAGFYKIFSPGLGDPAHYRACPAECAELSVTLFTPGFTQDGAPLHYWQTFEDIVAGTPLLMKGGGKVNASEGLRAQLLAESWKPNLARMHRSADPKIRTGGRGYLDVAAFKVRAKGRDVELHEQPVKVLPYDAVFPLNKACRVLVFGENRTAEQLDLACPAKPVAYLDTTYPGGTWHEAPYNRYDENLKRWIMDPRALDLETFLRQANGYQGPLANSGIASAKPNDDESGKRSSSMLVRRQA